METATLKEQYLAYKAANPKKRIRDIAAHLQVSEAELLMTGLGENTVLLENRFEDILQEIPALGHVMALTRNDHCVHERKGIYKNISFGPHAGLVLGEDIDLRLFMHQWKLGFAVEDKELKSLQFFDASGTAIHKVYLTEKSEFDSYGKLVNKFRHADQRVVALMPVNPPVKQERRDSEIDLVPFHAAWNAMQDTHEFFGLLKRFGLSRTQALRLAPAGYAYPIGITGFKAIMKACAGQEVPVMVFVGNHGCIQIHTGTITKLVETGPWFNVLDPKFNLHLREDAIMSAWHVIKPSIDGDINSIELFDQNGEIIAQFFGKRKPGIPELKEWKSILTQYLGA